MAANEPRPNITVSAKVGKAYDAAQRGVVITELQIPFSEWGKLQEIVLREAARGLGISSGRIVLRLARSDNDKRALADGTISVVRRGARAARRAAD